MNDTSHSAIAVVGVSAILPDAPNAGAFWENVKGGRYSITDVREDRWNPALYFDPDHAAPDKTYSKIGGWVRNAPWEPAKWKLAIPPRVVEAMDEGQRWALACAREVLVDFGYPDRPLDLERTAVILGNAMGGEKNYLTSFRAMFPELAGWLSEATSFQELPLTVREKILGEFHQRVGTHLPPITEDTMPGELSNCIAGRIANTFNLRGPNFTCDAACASALAAISAARDGLVAGEFDAVITGGVDRNMGASTFVKFAKIGALSATGTRPFAEGADGFVMGEGAALFMLKRLADAEKAGDRIYAVIRGMAGSSDGKGKGITAPNPIGQKLAVKRAWENAGIAPTEGMMIEAHGTSTPVGDVVEVESLAETLGGGLRPGSVALGSVKSNIGHLKSAAGAAGLLKTVLSLHEKVLAPSLSYRKPNPNVDWSRSPFRVNTELRPWERPASGVRTAGLSAFGFGGTNFHLVLEEYVPGRLDTKVRGRGFGEGVVTGEERVMSARTPLRGALVLGAASEQELLQRLVSVRKDAEAGKAPFVSAPAERDLRANERIAIDYGDAAELAAKATKAEKAFATGPAAFKALRAQGIFRGSGPAPKVAFLFTGQGSQYANMLRDLREREPLVRETFAEADRLMTPTLGKSLSELVFVDPRDEAAVKAAEESLRQTAITQPAVLSVDLALARVLGSYGVSPDLVMGHSLGEYGALVASGVMPFADALEAVSARGKEMSHVAVGDAGKMAAVVGPLEKIQQMLTEVPGYVVTANINSTKQVVLGGSTEGVTQAIEKFSAARMPVVTLSVSHAFHTKIVAPASEPLKKVLARLRLASPKVPVVANTTGELYPSGATAAQIIDILGDQVASPVQFVKGLRTLYAEGARVFVEVGPKRALQGFADDVLGDEPDVLTLATNHPKHGDVVALNHALCGLYSRGIGAAAAESIPEVVPVAPAAPIVPRVAQPASDRFSEIGKMFVDLLDRAGFSRGAPSGGTKRTEVVITGAALGLPGTERMFDDTNVARILAGEQLIDSIPNRLRKAMVDKHITRLVKKEGQDPIFESIDDPADVIKLAGRGGAFDLAAEFGVPADRADAFDVTTRMAIAAGIDALRDAGIPLVPRFRATSKGTWLPDGWALPESMRDDTGVIFASAFPGYNELIGDLDRFHEDHARRERLAELQGLRAMLTASDALSLELDRRIGEVEREIAGKPFAFDRRFLFKVLAMGHSQFAEYIRARGPNTQINAACASTTQATALAEDWIAAGRCRRVVVIAADDITSDRLLGWFGAGFLAAGAAATDESVADAATPFDRRRHGMIVGMGAAALVLESRDAAAERGLLPIVDLLGTVVANSAFHGTRLDVEHITSTMESLVRGAEARFGLTRQQIAERAVFVSHETYTPARGGSAAAEISALRHVFGAAADRIVIANTKGFTGHAMGAGIEDVVAVKSLETGVVPKVPNFKEVDPDLGPLNLSKGGSYPIEFALRLAAGFGSQISMSLMRRSTGTSTVPRPSPNALGFQQRIADPSVYQRWLSSIAGSNSPVLEVVHRTLRFKDQRPPAHVPAPAPALAPAPAPAPAPEVDDVAERVLALVAEKTGYPRDMLALDLDLEADLGVDTVKQAEVFATIRQAYDIPRDDTVKLRDYPTLGHVIRFVRERRPDLRLDLKTAATPAKSDDVEERVLALVAEKTGYPRDMLALDLDLEADLGVDTVKQAEVFATIRQAYDIPRDDTVKLRDYPTLGHVIRFVRERRPDLKANANANANANARATVDEVEERVLALVAEKTGYPRDMLALDLDLEADLGVDTVKQAEVFATIRQAYDIPRDDTVKLRDYPTLGHVIRFVLERRPQKPAAPVHEVAPEPRPAVETESRFPRRVPVPVLRPSLERCKETGASFEGKRVLVMSDAGGVADVLSADLTVRGARVLRISDAPERAELEARLASEGPIAGVFWLPALDGERPIGEMDLAAWKAAVHVRVKLAHAAMRALYGCLDAPGAFFVAGTRLGGQHGYDPAGAQFPLGGAVTGFTKALSREKPAAVVKCVDFEAKATAVSVAAALLEETLRDPAIVEVGRKDGLRWTIGFEEHEGGDATARLPEAKVFVVTGAAGSITSAITADLAAASGGTFYLLDRVPEPDRNDPDLERSETDREALKRDLFERLKARGERATPGLVEKELAVLERALAAKRAIVAVESAGGRARWMQADLRDGEAIERTLSEIRNETPKIDVLVHAAGLEISRLVPDKSVEEFDLIFDVKCDGLFHLLRAIGEMPLGALVVFSSIAGRFGNSGQTDYSAANDLLCKFASSFRTSRPTTRGLAIDWTAWASIGMASRGSIPKMMEAAGIEMLPPSIGIPVVREELTRENPFGEVVMAGSLGLLSQERDPDGGVLVDAFAPLHGPMLGRLTAVSLAKGVTVETTLDPSKQGFLFDHKIDQVAVLPGVMGVEAFAEVSALLLPGWSVVAVENVDFVAPFKFYRGEPRTLTVHAQLQPEGSEVVAHCELLGTRPIPGQPAQTTVHYRARVRLARGKPNAQSAAPVSATTGTEVGSGDIYKLYFHGPAYQVLERAWRDGGGAAALVATHLPSDHEPADLPLLTSPRLVESCFQTAGLFEMGVRGRMALPHHIDRVTSLLPTPDAGTRLYAVAVPSDGGFDARIVDATGKVYVEVQGYRTVELPSPVDAKLLAPLASAMA